MLPRSGFLSGVSPEFAGALERLASEVRLARKEVLFEQGDAGDALFAVIEGTLEVSVLSEDGRRFALDVLGPGAIVGEIALLDPGERTATVVALTEARLLSIRHDDLLGAIRSSPCIGVDIARLCGRRMRWMNRQLFDQVFLPVPTRLARKILYLATIGETPERLTMSQSDLAEFMGATRESVSKTLAEWKRLGLVQPERGGLAILDRAALARIAEAEGV